MVKILAVVLLLTWLKNPALSQQKDSLLIVKHDTLTHQVVKFPASKIDSLSKKKLAKKSDPGKATLYSAILPGLGQIYNKKYWKLPIVYAAVGIPVYTYFYNKSWYEKTVYALAVIANGSYNNVDSFNRVDVKLRAFVKNPDGTPNTYGATGLINYRNEFRTDQDYSALFFLLFWGLNIVDATVDAHLKGFDVSSDLSMSIHPVVFPATGAAGFSFVFDIHKAKPKTIFDE